MPIFIKFGGEDLNEAFLKVDVDFLKLSSASPDSFLKVEAKIKDVVNDIGGAFIKLGESFDDLSEFAVKIDTAFLKLAGGVTATAPSTDATAAGTQADFLKLDTTLKTAAGDLATLGADFLKLNAAPDLITIKMTDVIISGAMQKISTDMGDASGAFLKLGTDLVAMGTGENSNSPQFNEALKILGNDFDHKESAAFETLAVDWNKLSQDFANLAGGGTTTTVSLSSSTDSTPGTLGSDFMKLEQDFLVLNHALAGTAPDIKAAFDAFADQLKPSENDHKGDVFGSPGNFGHG